MIREISIAGLKITAAPEREIIEAIAKRLSMGQKTRIITPYSEFLVAALRNNSVMTMLSSADISIADGVGMLWAATFLNLPIRAKNKLLRLAIAVAQMISSGAQILLNPKSIYRVIPEKIVGADFFLTLVKFAIGKNVSIYLLGGRGDTALRTGQVLRKQYPNLRIAGYSDKDINDPTILTDIEKAQPDFLFVAFNPIAQDAWISLHLETLTSVKLAMGVGGTFDYVSGHKKQPPKAVRRIGLEWLFRLVTQPYRYKRIYNATFGLITLLISYKVRHIDEDCQN